MLFAVASQAARCPATCQKESVGGHGLSGWRSDFISQLCKLSTGGAQRRPVRDGRPAQARPVRAPCGHLSSPSPVLCLRGAEGQQRARPRPRAVARLGSQAARLRLGDPWALPRCFVSSLISWIAFLILGRSAVIGGKVVLSVFAAAVSPVVLRGLLPGAGLPGSPSWAPDVPGRPHLSLCCEPGLNRGGGVSGRLGGEAFPWRGSLGLLPRPCGFWGARPALSQLPLDTPQ